MALALLGHVRDKPQLPGNWHKRLWLHFRDYVDEVHVLRQDGKTSQLEGRDMNRFAANPSFLRLALEDEILRSFWLLT